MEKLKMSLKIISLVLIVALSSCATGKFSQKKPVRNNSITLEAQDNECVKKLDKCVKQLKVNQDILKDVNQLTEYERRRQFILGLSVGSFVVTGVSLMFLVVCIR